MNMFGVRLKNKFTEIVITVFKIITKEVFLLAKFIKTNGNRNKKFLFQIGGEWEINFCKIAFFIKIK